MIFLKRKPEHVILLPTVLRMVPVAPRVTPSLCARSLETQTASYTIHSPIPSSRQPLWTVYDWKNTWCARDSAILHLLLFSSSVLQHPSSASHGL